MKKINDKPVGKIRVRTNSVLQLHIQAAQDQRNLVNLQPWTFQVAMIRQRLKKGTTLSFQEFLCRNCFNFWKASQINTIDIY